jgi:hypothetical protein
MEEKREALEFVLASRTFARHEQLRAFLRYVCEQEMTGKGGELHEYLIGIEVLGRSPGYSTSEDSTVRSRAHALRRKLQDFYLSEASESGIVIELPKGSYCPRFVIAEKPVGPSIGAPAIDEPAAEKTPVMQSKAGKWKFWSLIVAISSAAALLFGFIGYQLGSERAKPRIDPVLKEAWGTLIEPDSNVLVCVANTANLFVRNMPDANPPHGSRRLPPELGLEGWYRERQQLPPEHSLFLLPNHNSPLWGDAAGAMSVIRTLTRADVSFQLLPERVEDPFALRDRNVVLLGRPEYSRAAALILDRAFYKMKYDERLHDQEIYYVDPQTSLPVVLSRRQGEIHGLITVVNSDSPREHNRRTVVISGVNSAGSLAAAEFFSSVENLLSFRRILHRDGFRSFPSAYQIVIAAEEDKILPFRYSFERYKVLSQ